MRYNGFHHNYKPHHPTHHTPISPHPTRLTQPAHLPQNPPPTFLIIPHIRYPDELHPYKYAGYPLLLEAIKKAAEPPGDGSAAGDAAKTHFLQPTIASRLQAATELCWLTGVCSRLNGEELCRSGGVDILAK